MRLVYQRVHRASITINHNEMRRMDRGAVWLFGVEKGDDPELVESFLTKALNLRCFPKDLDQPKMDLSVQDIQGSVLFVSQFTLCASHKKGNRPDFMTAEEPAKAQAIYDQGVSFLKSCEDITLITGEFGAHMDIELVNDGPVTFIF